jgi:hypothetical protein
MEQLGWIGCVQDNAWFDQRVGQIWIEKVLEPYVRDADKALLLLDHFLAHLTSSFVKAINDLGVDVDYVPAGYTCVLQPVDVGVNATFKKAIRNHHHNWCIKEYPKTSNNDKLPTPGREEVYDWIVRSLEEVSEESIRKTYKYIGFVQNDNDSNNEEENTTSSGSKESETETEEEGFF